jgi:hypothetical protein
MGAVLGIHNLELLLLKEDSNESMDVGWWFSRAVLKMGHLAIFLLLEHLPNSEEACPQENPSLLRGVEAEGAPWRLNEM